MATPVLFISRQRLVGRTNGSSAYLLDLAQSVREAGFVPHLVQPTPRVAGRWPYLRLRPEMDVFETHAIRGLLRLGNLFISPSPMVWAAAGRGIASRLLRKAGFGWRWLEDKPFGYVIAEPWQGADLRYLKRQEPGGIAVLDYMFCAEGLAGLEKQPRSAIVMHDLFHAREGRADDTVSAISRERELGLLGLADAVIAIQASEASFVAQELPGSDVILAPIAAQDGGVAQTGTDDRLLFVGSNTGPNVVGLRWFLSDVWPLVKAARPLARLDVAGTVGWAFAGEACDGVRFLGMVDRLELLYAQAGMVISPLTFGSGLKIKLIEALAHGKAVVATSVTLQGVEAEAGPAIALADDAADFATACLRFCSDAAARQAFGQAAIAVTQAHFSRAACHQDFVAWLRQGPA